MKDQVQNNFILLTLRLILVVLRVILRLIHEILLILFVIFLTKSKANYLICFPKIPFFSFNYKIYSTFRPVLLWFYLTLF